MKRQPGQEPRAPRRREVNSGQFAPGEMERGKIRGSSKERTLLRWHAEPGKAHGLSPWMLLVRYLLKGTQYYVAVPARRGWQRLPQRKR